MRDKIKSENYFQTLINERKESLEKRIYKLNNGLISVDRITPVYLNIISTLIDIIKAKYSLGEPIENLKFEYSNCVQLVYKYWGDNVKFIGPNNEKLNQYSLDNYDEMLWLLSLGYLLDVPNDEFNKLIYVIDKGKVKDKLFEFVISAKIPNRQKIQQESYKFGWKLFSKLREAIEIKEINEVSYLIKTYLEKEWYKEHKNAKWYNSHKSKFKTYTGYWSFETAAVVAILDLDDSSFRYNQYYPKDLVDYYKKNHSIT